MAQRKFTRTLQRAKQRHAVVIGAGSFGTAIAVLLERAGVRTTLVTRTSKQAEDLAGSRENRVYLPGVKLGPKISVESADASLVGAQLVFLAVPAAAVREVVERLDERSAAKDFAVISLTKGLLSPDGTLPTDLLTERFGGDRVATVGGPSHALEMVDAGAGLVAASTSRSLRQELAGIFLRSRVVCEESNDPLGVELAGAAKNAAALAAGATVSQGLNATGAAASHIFAEAWELGKIRGASFDSFIGLAGIGDLIATVLAPGSRNRQAGELLASGVRAEDIPSEIGQAVESLESVQLMARQLKTAKIEAPVTTALAELVEGKRSLKSWTKLVRTAIPPKRWRQPGRLHRWWHHLKR